mgnify:CR=1 FL=1
MLSNHTVRRTFSTEDMRKAKANLFDINQTEATEELLARGVVKASIQCKWDYLPEADAIELRAEGVAP